MKKATRLICWLLCTVVFIVLAGCSTPGPSIVGTIPPDSRFAKISIDMSRAEVHDLIGRPTNSHGYSTGKGFIPFYFGSDRMRFEDLYKGEGRITFTGVGVGGINLKVYKIEYDPNERGYPQ